MVLAAGDIAACDSNGDEVTAELLDDLDGTILTLGDNVYPDGTTAEFANCYTPSWGRHLGRTFPNAGNQDYETDAAAGYFAYFGDRTGEPGEGTVKTDTATMPAVTPRPITTARHSPRTACHASPIPV